MFVSHILTNDYKNKNGVFFILEYLDMITPSGTKNYVLCHAEFISDPFIVMRL